MIVSVVPIISWKSPVNVLGIYSYHVNTKTDINSIIQIIMSNKELNEFVVIVKDSKKEYMLYFFGKDQTKEQFVEGLRIMLMHSI